MKKSSRGFTIIEMLVVLGIIAFLAGVLFQGIGSAQESAMRQSAKIFVTATLRSSLERYRLEMGSYPTTAEGLQALITAPAGGGNADRWHGPYLEVDGGKLPADPWGEAYQFRSPGTKNKTKYDIFSKGPDKTEGTADDIGNW